MNAHLAVRTGERMVAMGSQSKGGDSVDSERELMLEEARSISEGLWRMARLPPSEGKPAALRLTPRTKVAFSRGARTSCSFDCGPYRKPKSGALLI